ncbi:MAG: TonB family protein [Bacteroidota bacterium]
MSTDRNHSEAFERYLKGQMSPEEAHAFERKALEDPFTQEALAGFEAAEPNAINDINELKKRIQTRKKKDVSFMRIAAAIALLIVGSFTIYMSTDKLEDKQLAMENESIEETIQNTPAPDTVALTRANKVDETITKEPQLANENSPETFKQDGLRVEKKADDIVELALEEEVSEEELIDVDDYLLAEEISDVSAESMDGELEEKNEISDQVQGKVARMKIASSDFAVIDSIVISEVTPQALVAQQTTETKKNNVPRFKKQSQYDQEAASLRSTASTETITGHVTDDAGEPLPGLNVILKGTTIGVTTDFDGNYVLPKTEDMILVYSYIGFETQEIEVGDRNTLDVVMTTDGMELQEVVITGVGTANGEDAIFQPATPENGRKSYKSYLETNLKYPQAAKENEIEGTVVLQVLITSSGRIGTISVKKSLGYGCDEEAKRLVREGPAWEPAKKGNNTIEDEVRVKVKFKL